MCTSIFQEVVNYYNRNVCACLVDASKAFDRNKYSKLFQTLLKRNLPGTIVRLLSDSYTRQQSFAKWGQEFSNVIYIHSGVKQGGVPSATRFCIYMFIYMSLFLDLRDLILVVTLAITTVGFIICWLSQVFVSQYQRITKDACYVILFQKSILWHITPVNQSPFAMVNRVENLSDLCISIDQVSDGKPRWIV